MGDITLFLADIRKWLLFITDYEELLDHKSIVLKLWTEYNASEVWSAAVIMIYSDHLIIRIQIQIKTFWLYLGSGVESGWEWSICFHFWHSSPCWRLKHEVRSSDFRTLPPVKKVSWCWSKLLYWNHKNQSKFKLFNF